ncbi:hypothetical protein TNIN_153231 [Trichonephila inaurata madagascariensis]|uniref:Uncharacterized protein n=1 Tax=Trichonephila inaurata madagascariensis TaxID=2747483 RepID=A0A8X6XR61_9ARAC|nr:hypothetical protein TNIN_153231 [Trichonephila inaurata madagascariensis]
MRLWERQSPERAPEGSPIGRERQGSELGAPGNSARKLPQVLGVEESATLKFRSPPPDGGPRDPLKIGVSFFTFSNARNSRTAGGRRKGLSFRKALGEGTAEFPKRRRLGAGARKRRNEKFVKIKKVFRFRLQVRVRVSRRTGSPILEREKRFVREVGSFSLKKW